MSHKKYCIWPIFCTYLKKDKYSIFNFFQIFSVFYSFGMVLSFKWHQERNFQLKIMEKLGVTIYI